MTRVLICGSRDWNNGNTIKAVLRTLGAGVVVINGACRGADLQSSQAGRDLGLEVKEFPADWSRYGIAAGPIRNQSMLNKSHPNLVIAFHENLFNSSGTIDMLRRARKAEIKFRIFSLQGEVIDPKGYLEFIERKHREGKKGRTTRSANEREKRR